MSMYLPPAPAPAPSPLPPPPPLSSSPWSPLSECARRIGISRRQVNAAVALLDEGATVPFIARYRAAATGDASIEALRRLALLLPELRALVVTARRRAASVESASARAALLAAKSPAELDEVWALCRPPAKGSLAERARKKGLGPVAESVLAGKSLSKSQLKIAEGQGLTHLLAEAVATDAETWAQAKELFDARAVLTSRPRNSGSSSSSSRNNSSKAKSGVGRAGKVDKKMPKVMKKKLGGGGVCGDGGGGGRGMYQNYHAFGPLSLSRLRPHQVLALLRGEREKCLTITVKLEAPTRAHFVRLVKKRWMHRAAPGATSRVLEIGIEDAITRLLLPRLVRHARRNLQSEATDAAVANFKANVRALLLARPFTAPSGVLALDPGFAHGVKYAMLDTRGAVLETGVTQPHAPHHATAAARDHLLDMLQQYGARVVAIGNGTACRETERFVSEELVSKLPGLRYCIVPEAGASVYSISPEAERELPRLSPGARGAVSIGRRLLDPMAELVKVDPAHLGVGMYQLDVPPKRLESALSGAVEDCVAEVGADLNRASAALLAHVPGMSITLAQKVVAYRDAQGTFTVRAALRNVPGIGPSTYAQVVGFCRVAKGDIAGGGSSGGSGVCGGASKKPMIDLLEEALGSTRVHPEAYGTAAYILHAVDASSSDVGSAALVTKMKELLADNVAVSKTASAANTDVQTLRLVAAELTRNPNEDRRAPQPGPVFRERVYSLAEAPPGTLLRGRVSNVTDFGAFVDCGLGTDGLLHTSAGRAVVASLAPGYPVDVVVLSVDTRRGRLSLGLPQAAAAPALSLEGQQAAGTTSDRSSSGGGDSGSGEGWQRGRPITLAQQRSGSRRKRKTVNAAAGAKRKGDNFKRRKRGRP
eukprot:UC1_evm5s1007